MDNNVNQSVSFQDSNVNQPVVNNQTPMVNFIDNSVKDKKPFNKKIIFIILGVLLLVGIGIYFILNKDDSFDNSRSKELINLDDHKTLKFKINDIEYKIGDSVSKYKKVYKIGNEFDNIQGDYVVVSPFSIGNDTHFLGFIYCPLQSGCDYSNSILIKINFYESSKVLINDKLSFKSDYDDFIKELGEPSGIYYQDDSLYIWSFGNEIGDPYIVAGFDEGGLFSLGYLRKLQLGVWWYEDEYKNTIVKIDKNKLEEK